MLQSDQEFARRLLRWYRRCRRDLPWRSDKHRPGPVDPYYVLVSETMLQQTQVATVVPYFLRFVARFPTLADLAGADEQDVLRLWQGLGYYTRARNLLATARKVVHELGGKLPNEPAELLKLPGIGRYTAGAIASIAFDRRAPILDGNVMRVLCRLEDLRSDPREPASQRLLWRRAEEILPKRSPGDFNSALMELGATICTPKNPQCLVCPVRAHCGALAAGMQEKIPAPRRAKPTPLERRRTYCIRRENRWLIEQRPARGRWAGMWQFVTREAGDDREDQTMPLAIGRLVRLGMISHALTHRRYEFEVFVAQAEGDDLAADAGRKWVTLAGLERYPLPRPHVKIAQMLRESANLKISRTPPGLPKV